MNSWVFKPEDNKKSLKFIEKPYIKGVYYISIPIF
jgi:hypothetical protein